MNDAIKKSLKALNNQRLTIIKAIENEAADHNKKTKALTGEMKSLTRKWLKATDAILKENIKIDCGLMREFNRKRHNVQWIINDEAAGHEKRVQELISQLEVLTEKWHEEAGIVYYTPSGEKKG